jgi:formate dehydrogenase (NADP+) beta subunit
LEHTRILFIKGFEVLASILFTLGLGGTCGIVLSFASKVFYVYEDPRIGAVENYLAGANCGGCGYPGCSGAAEAIVSGNAPPSVCILVGPENVAAIAAISGGEAGTAEALKSYNECLGGSRASDRFIYRGVNKCNAVASLYGGKRDCTIGCLGYGDCIRACKFNAIEMGPDNYPVINFEKCVGCGACELSAQRPLLRSARCPAPSSPETVKVIRLPHAARPVRLKLIFQLISVIFERASMKPL